MTTDSRMAKVVVALNTTPRLSLVSDEEASFLSPTAANRLPNAAGAARAAGFRDSASWIRKESVVPPPSPIVTDTDVGVISPTGDGKVRQLRELFDHSARKASQIQSTESNVSKVRGVAAKLDGKRDSSLSSRSIGREVKLQQIGFGRLPSPNNNGKIVSPNQLSRELSGSFSLASPPNSTRITCWSAPTAEIASEPHRPVADLAKVFEKSTDHIAENPIFLEPHKPVEFRARHSKVASLPRSSPVVTNHRTFQVSSEDAGSSLKAMAEKPKLIPHHSSDEIEFEQEFEPLMEEVATLALETGNDSDSDNSSFSQDPVDNNHSPLYKTSLDGLLLQRGRSSAVVSNHPPVLAGDEPGDLDKPWRDFYKSIMEILTTEISFVSRWHIANRLFIKPLLARLGEERTCRLVPLHCWQNIFRFHEALLQELEESLDELWGYTGLIQSHRRSVSMGLEELVEDSQRNLHVLNERLKRKEPLESALTRARVKAWFLRLNNTMLRHADALIIAREFIVHHPFAMRYLETMSNKKKAFLAELESAPELQGLRFRDFLVQPVQNVCRYHLLFKAVLDKAPEEELRAAAITSQNKFATIAQRVNEAMKNEERRAAEELMARLKNQHGNAKFVEKLFPKGLRQPRNSLERGELNLSDVTAVPIRQGEVQIISIVGGDADMQNLGESLTSRGKITGLLCMNQLLLIESSRRWSGTDPVILHSFRFNLDWENVQVEEDSGQPDLLHLIFEPKDGPRRGEIRVSIQVTETSKQGWLKDLREVCRLAESARQREHAAQQQMAKRHSLTPRLSNLSADGLSSA